MAIGAIELEQVDLALSGCTHPQVTTEGGDSDVSWCNVCGAIMTSAGWLQPHWRDLLIKLVKHEVEPDDKAVMNLHRNQGKPKCTACNGSGQVMKYIRPNVVGMVDCLSCKGTGRRCTRT